MSPFWCFPLDEPGVETVRHCAAQDGTRQRGAALKIRDAVLHRWGEALYLENICILIKSSAYLSGTMLRNKA